jgi:hypothetical protein
MAPQYGSSKKSSFTALPSSAALAFALTAWSSIACAENLDLACENERGGSQEIRGSLNRLTGAIWVQVGGFIAFEGKCRRATKKF